jgi:hypothetical protein
MNYTEHWIAGEPAPMYECRLCGSLVISTYTHSKWHRFPVETE